MNRAATAKAVPSIFDIQTVSEEGSWAFEHWRLSQDPGAPPPKNPYTDSPTLAWAWDFGFRLMRHIQREKDPAAAARATWNAQPRPTDAPPAKEGWFSFGGRKS